MAGLFAYGTLMCDDIMESVSGLKPKCSSALLRGYKRIQVKNQQYPGIVADTSASVAGLVYVDISENGWRRLDAFEGEMYMRLPVEVILADGTSQMADTYVVREEYRYRLSSLEWSFAEFQRQGKEVFVNTYEGYGDIQ